MNQPSWLELNAILHEIGYDEAVKRLKGVQGPEQGLVEESRSARQQGAAEEVKPGERDVAEIVGATKLWGIIAIKLIEARREEGPCANYRDSRKWHRLQGRIAVLEELSAISDGRTEKRSDLCNV